MALPRAVAGLICAAAATFFAGAAAASAFTVGEFESYSQNTWGADPLAGPPASLVQADFDTVYPGGMVLGENGPGLHFLEFTSGGALLDFLPQTGPIAPLSATLIDPTTSSSGLFGGQVAGLRLNLDFSDANLIHHPTGVAFGDLIITGDTGGLSGLDGLAVRDVYGLANDILAGDLSPFSLTDISAELMRINSAFEGGYVSSYADAHLALPTLAASAPEPSLWAMLILGLGAVGALARRRGRIAAGAVRQGRARIVFAAP